MPRLSIVVEYEVWRERAPGAETVIETAIAAAEAALGRSIGGELVVALISDQAQRVLNKRHRGKDTPTNVLAFPADQHHRGVLGDVALALETVIKEAEMADKLLDDHVAHLAIHGFLHLLGYDHDDDASAEEMETLERSALAMMGVADPYREEFNA